VPKNEDGEFELILGNRQLLSVFFIVVVLFCVFFTMGYIVGRNSSPVSTPEIASQPRPDTRPAATEPTSSREATEPVKDTPVTTAAQQTPVQEPRKESAKRIIEDPPAAKKELPSYKAVVQSNAQPAAGQTYLQLAATVKHEADAMVEVLRKNGFASAAQEVPEKPGVFRVLVGPLHEEVINRTRSDLQGKGFPGNIAIKKTF
jgi:cell division septation protein DedD